MGWKEILYYTVKFVEACSVLISVKLIRCALISLPVLGIILILRRIGFKKAVFGKCMLWSFILFLPFLGSLRFHYETRPGVRASWWIVCLFMEHRFLTGIYLAGILTALLLMVRRHRRISDAVVRMDTLSMESFGKIYISDMAVSPFTVGCLRPRIIIPEALLSRLGKEELEVILQHERTHIRLGHLWMLLFWEILQCIFWVNPLFWLGFKYFREDLEQICDRVCIQNSSVDAYSYGNVLLDSGKLLAEQLECGGLVTFAGENDYETLKRRMKKIAEYRMYTAWRPALTFVFFLILLFGGFGIIRYNSYPRYTNFDDVGLYDEAGNCVLPDSQALRRAVEIRKDTVYIKRQALKELLAETGARRDLYFLYFGGYFKLPGIGGGGDGVIVDFNEASGDMEIPYDSSDDIWTFLFRYL